MKMGAYPGVGIALLMWSGLLSAEIRYVASGQDIQAVIDAANSGDEIEVAPGTYQGPGDETEDSALIDFKGKAIRLYSRDGSAVTTISGRRYQHGVRCISGEDARTILEGFTITLGGWGEYPSGGGMYNYDSSPTIMDCVFKKNHAYYSGGAMYNRHSSPTIIRCLFADNGTYTDGGAMSTDVGNPVLTDCVFRNNDSGHCGGAMRNSFANPVLINCLFAGNSATLDGAGLSNTFSNPMMINCTFADNRIDTTEGKGGGALYNYLSTFAAVNCIFWGNTGDPIVGSAGWVDDCDIQGGWPADGNIDADPRFVGEGDYHLLPGSPCIDAGTSSTLLDLPATDLDGNPRQVDGNGSGPAYPDMGAYEASTTYPRPLLAALMRDVRDLQLDPALSDDLLAKLNAACAVLCDDDWRNDKTAIESLNAFISSVQAEQGRRIAQEDADALIGAAQLIIDLLNSG